MYRCASVCVFVVRYISVAGARRIELGGLVGSLDRLTTQLPPPRASRSPVVVHKTLDLTTLRCGQS